MSMPGESLPKTEFSIHPGTRIGGCRLTVANLDRQVEFYQKVIGLQLLQREGQRRAWARVSRSC